MKKILLIILIAIVSMSSIGGVYAATHIKLNIPIQQLLKTQTKSSAEDSIPAEDLAFLEEILSEQKVAFEEATECPHCKDRLENDSYELVDFKAPDKTVYTMDEVYNFSLIDTDGISEIFFQQIDFDGTGTSMTIRNKETGEIEKYEYEDTYIMLGDEKFQCDENIFFDFHTKKNEELKEGVYTALAIVMTPDGDCIQRNFTFTLVDE